MSSWRLSRRAVLEGLGYSLALPLLDVMLPRGASAQTASPPRFISFFMSLGTYGKGYDPTKNDASRYPSTSPWLPGGMGVWQPKATGVLTAALPPALAPLESLKQKISVLSGLGTLLGDSPGTGVNHSASTTSWATSAWKSSAAATANNIVGGQPGPANNTPPDSLDQYIANALGFTPGSTLVLNPAGNADYSETGQGGHGGAISYNSKLAAAGSSVVPRISDPKTAFSALFGTCSAQTSPSAGQKSILDYVKGSIPKVQQKLGTNDKARLDSYLQNVRDLETKLATVQACPTVPTASPALTGGPLDAVSKLNMMVDVIALAVSSGVMPIASLMTNLEATAISGDSASYAVDFLSTFVGLSGQRVKYHSPTLDTHFDITHVESTSQAIEEHIAYTQLSVTFLQRLIQKLDSMPVEPNGLTPLDNTIILAGAAHANPGSHDTHNLPTLVAGGKRYRMMQGQHIAFPMVTDIGDLYFTLAKAMGVAGTSFNGHSTALSGLFST